MLDKIPFPQANDFEKIVCLMSLTNEKDLTDFDFMGAFLGGISERQVSYYLSAAMYLGLIDCDKQFTELGNIIRCMDDYLRIIELIRVVISDPIIGKAYISQKVLGLCLSTEDIADMIREYYPDYTQPIYIRRAQTVQSWLTWIEKHVSPQ